MKIYYHKLNSKMERRNVPVKELNSGGLCFLQLHKLRSKYKMVPLRRILLAKMPLSITAEVEIEQSIKEEHHVETAIAMGFPKIQGEWLVL